MQNGQTEPPGHEAVRFMLRRLCRAVRRCARTPKGRNTLNDAARGIGLPKPERVMDMLAMIPMLYSIKRQAQNTKHAIIHMGHGGC